MASLTMWHTVKFVDSPETQKSKYFESAAFFLLIKKFSYYKFCHTVKNSFLAVVNLYFFFLWFRSCFKLLIVHCLKSIDAQSGIFKTTFYAKWIVFRGLGSGLGRGNPRKVAFTRHAKESAINACSLCRGFLEILT